MQMNLQSLKVNLIIGGDGTISRPRGIIPLPEAVDCWDDLELASDATGAVPAASIILGSKLPRGKSLGIVIGVFTSPNTNSRVPI